MRKPRIFTCEIGATHVVELALHGSTAPDHPCGTAAHQRSPNGDATNRSAVRSAHDRHIPAPTAHPTDTAHPTTPDRHRLQPLVEDVDLGVPHGRTDRHRRTGVLRRHLGGSPAPQPRSARTGCAPTAPSDAPGTLARSPPTAPHRPANTQPQRIRASSPTFDRATRRASTARTARHVTSPARQTPRQIRRITMAIGSRDHHASTGHERQQELPHRHIERRRSLQEHRHRDASDTELRLHPQTAGSRSTPCDTATPFGRPVDPDVKITYAVFAGRNGATTIGIGHHERSARSDTSRVDL